jgi:hypothetical protein
MRRRLFDFSPSEREQKTGRYELQIRFRNRFDMANPTGRGGFAKGKSGNPGSRPRQLASVMHEARRHTLEALQVQLQLMQSAESESVRLNAAEAILNRGWGRPIQALQVDGRFLMKKLTDLTTDEIRDLEQRVEMIEPDQGVLALTGETENLQP